MLTSRVPFEGKTLVDVAIKHVQEDPVPPARVAPSVDARLEAICLKALKKEKAERYQSARDMRADVRTVMAAPPSAPSIPRGPVSRVAPTWPAPAPERTTSNVTPTATSLVPRPSRRRAGLSVVVLAVVFAATAAAVRTRARHSNAPVALSPLPSPVISLPSTEQRAVATAEYATIPGTPPSRGASAQVVTTSSRESQKTITHPTTRPVSAAAPIEPTVEPPVEATGASGSQNGKPNEPRGRALGSPPLWAAAADTAATSALPAAASPLNATPAPATTVPAARPATPFDPSRAHVTWSVAAIGGGATAGGVRRSLSRVSGAWDACYQDALRMGGRRVDGSGVLHIATDEEGNVVQATVTGFALSSAQTCVANAARVRIAGVDTGSAWADVKLVFRAEAPE